MARPFVDYYQKNKISPVSQDISDISKHFQRRSSLLKHLGIPPALIQGRTMIEFGPGSGHNSCFFASLKPKRYVIVEKNQTALGSIREFVKDFPPMETEIVESFIEDFQSIELFDLVICEGVIPFQKEPSRMLRHISKFVRPEGIIVVTCADSVSYLSDTLRRILGQALIDSAQTIENQAISLIPVFKEHFTNLKGMSRPIKDWILDNVLQPFYGQFFSIQEAIGAINDEFEAYQSSPHFLVDWRWYKDLFGKQRKCNELAIEQYQENLHNLLNYKEVLPPRSSSSNCELRKIGEDLFNISKKVISLVESLVSLVDNFSSSTSRAFQDYSMGLSRIINGEKNPDFGSFKEFFGRGQQYLSFIKKSESAQ